MDLRGLMDCAGYPEPMLRLVNNYRLHVLEVRRFANIQAFPHGPVPRYSDLSSVPGDKEAERRFYGGEPRVSTLKEWGGEASDVITVITGSRELEQVKEQYREEGGRSNVM